MRNRFSTIAFALSLGLVASGQTATRMPSVVQPIDENHLVRLHGNTRPEATAANDRGMVADSLPLDHMFLQMKRSPEQETELQNFLDDLQNPRSANYHHFLTSDQFGQRFGAASQDLSAVTNWLTSHGFTVHGTHPNGMIVDFSGTAGQVRAAFHTEIHNLVVNGEHHIANMSDPQIPEALSPVVAGVVSLHDFRPRPMLTQRAQYTFTYSGTPYQAVVPGDLATIYDFNPAFSAGYTGKGQTIVVLEDSDVYSTNDFTTFRSTFGLSQAYPNGSLTQVHPTGTAGGACTDPGANADDAEAEIDVEWASAAAPNATIELASCADTRTNFGGFIALQNLLAQSTYPKIVSISYGESEAQNGATNNAYINTLYQNAAALGVSIFVSAGDEGAASSDAGATSASHGITVSAFASTPNNVAVGGTDFADGYEKNQSTYWSSTNGTYYNSALSYIPEIPWNDSCASVLLATALGYPETYGSSGLCASSFASKNGLLAVVAGSGGPSNCATGSPSKSGTASGTCKGYTKPQWQSAAGNPSDGVRDIPDVALFAANGLWGHYYVVCYSDPGRNRGGAPCTGAPSSWAGFGGTSVSSPIMAGVQALINQKLGAAQGNPAPTLYSLANSSGCPSGSACPFHDTTLGDMDVNCSASSPNCYGSPTSTGRNANTNGGVLSTSTTAYSIAYGTGTGWDFSSGLGSVDVFKLVTSWP